MAEKVYDVIVLGGGAGGIPAAIRSAQLGGRVAVVEMADWGGQCMNRGCIPLGHMMKASQIMKDLALGKEMGLEGSGVRFNYPSLLRRQDEIIAFMRQGVRATLKKNGVDLIEGKGKIVGKRTVQVRGEHFTSHKIILATGARWQKPSFPGAETEGVVNTDFVLRDRTLPQRVLLFGESPWLIEIAQFLALSGSRVTLATAQKRILAEESKAVAARLGTVLRNDGVELRTRAAIGRVARGEDGLAVQLLVKGVPQEMAVDTVVTLERVPDLREIGLKNIGLDEDSPFLAVNERAETAAQGVYAVGDVTAPSAWQYSHRAAQMGIVAAENAMGQEASFDPRTLVRILFTHPQVASVGMTSREAGESGYEIVMGAAPLAMNALGMILAENEGIVEVVADKRYGEILGIHAIGSAVSEMIGQALLLIQMEATLHELASMAFPHPTLCESLAEAARDALGRPIYLP